MPNADDNLRYERLVLNADPLRQGYSYGSERFDKLPTEAEKLDALQRQAQENGQPFNRAVERRVQRGGARTPYYAFDGEAFTSVKKKDKRNREIWRQLGAYDRGEAENPLPWLTGQFPVEDVATWKANLDKRDVTSFEELWEESRNELLNSGGYTFIDGVLRETPLFFDKGGIGVAYVSFTLKRPNIFARIYRAVKEAF